MLARVFALVLLAPSAVLATSYSFRTQPTGPLGGPVRFEFRAESTAGAKRDVTSLTVSKRTLDHTWKPVWSISGRRSAPLRHAWLFSHLLQLLLTRPQMFPAMTGERSSYVIVRHVCSWECRRAC